MEQSKIPVIAVLGPTASGKTALSIALAKELGGEVVSADSMQIYRGMDIATAKPTEEEMDGVPHHLIGYVGPEEPYSLGRYAADAHAAIADVHSRGRLPILCGGTGLYMDTVLDNRDIGETGSDPAIRAELSGLAKERGGEYLLSVLREFDPETAAALHANNLPRIIRAIEVYRLSGVTMSELQRKSRETPERYHTLRIGIAYQDRAVLYGRINRRVDLMMEQGLLEEAKAFRAENLGTSAQAIGYKELFPYLDGEKSLLECLDSLKQATRRYAKRQLTWFRRDGRIYWVYPDAEDAKSRAFSLARRFLAGGNLENPGKLIENC